MPIAAARPMTRRVRDGVRVPLPTRRARYAFGLLALLACCAVLAPTPAQAQTVGAPSGLDLLSRVLYGGTPRTNSNRPATGVWQASFPFHSASDFKSIIVMIPANTCASGVNLEIGWYKSTALTTRLSSLNTISNRAVIGIFTPASSGEYRFLAYCKSGTTYSAAVNLMGANGKVTLTPPALRAGSVTATTATLTITGHTAAWWYKGNQSSASCTSVAAGTRAVGLTGLTNNTAYIYKAYSNSGCTTEIATAPQFTTGSDTGGGLRSSRSIHSDAVAAPSFTLRESGNDRDGGRDDVTLAWNPVANPFASPNASPTGKTVQHYELRFKRAGGDWIRQGVVNGQPNVWLIAWNNIRGCQNPRARYKGCHDVRDLAAGTYEFQMRSVAYGPRRAYYSSPSRAEIVTVPFTGVRPMSRSNPSTVTLGAGPDWGSEGKVAEGAVAAIRATRTGSTAAALSIPVKVNPLDTEADDYDARDSYTIEFEAGKSEATLEIPTYADTDGYDERFNVWMVRYALPEGVVPGDPHHVYVTIEDPGGAPVAQTGPAAPDAVDTASIGVVHNGSGLSASWDAPEGATHYDVTYYAVGAAHARAAWNRAGTSLTITCDSRYPGQKRDCVSAANAYHVGIRARNDAGESAWVYSAAPAVAPPGLSVADATVAEGPLATMDFAVTLSRAATGTVTVDYATRDGTASAAAIDYLAASGTLRFAPGETSKTVSVVVMDDAHDEASETLTLALSNASGAMISDATATGTITNADPLQRQWLARFGRTVAGQMIDALEGRFAMGPGARSHMVIGGERLDFSGAPPPPPEHDRWTGGEALVPETRGMDMRELLLGSSFHFTAGQASGMGAMTGWGKALSGSSSGSPSGGLSFTSETVTGVLGMDWERDNLLVGLALSESVETGAASSGSSGYDLEGSLFMATPYARLKASDRLSFWTMLGSGEGSMRVAYGDARQSADIALQVVAAGGRADLLRPDDDGGLALALKTDAFFVRTESESVSTPGFGRLAGAAGSASRVRAVLEGSRAFALSGGGSVEPSLTLGLRHDGGDAETGSGLEIGAGLAWSDPSSGLTSELRLYGLAAHEDGGYDEWGASGSLRIAPDPSGRGVSLSMTPSWGAQGQVGRTWDAQPSALAAGGGEPPAARLDTELGYGLFLSDDLTGTPYAGLGFGRDREYRLGWRLASGRWESFSLGLEATRREAANDDDPAVHDVMLRSALRW